MSERLIVGLTGMPGTGKTFMSSRLQGLGCELFTIGSVLKSQAAERGITIRSRDDSAKLFYDIFSSDPLALARPALEASGDVVIDSIRVPAHADVLRRYAPYHQARFVLLAAVCDAEEVCFDRVSRSFEERGSRDPLTLQAFKAENEPERFNSDPTKISVQRLVGEADFTIDTSELTKTLTAQAVENFWALQP